MNAFQKKVALRVTGVHLAVVFLVLTIPFLRGCFRRKPKEIVTFIEFGAPAPQVSIEPVSQLPDPEPPAPAPEPEPEPIPKPIPKPKPKPVPEPKPKPKAEKPKPKPKWKPVDPKKIKIGRKVNETPSKPAVSSAEIKKALSGIAASSASTGDPSRFNDYFGRVMRLFYTHWKPPSTATSATGSTVVRISMRKNGQIVKRRKIKGSGDAVYDRTVMDAVNSVGTMPKPPPDYPYDYVEVVFTLEN